METKIGTKFGFLTTESLPYRKFGSETSKQLATYIDVRCICDKKKSIRLSHLKTLLTISCGCESTRRKILRIKTHGLRKHPLYITWSSMKARCYNPHNSAYKYYGGRGINICDEWKNDFKTFYDWAIANGWQYGLEIDRFPNNENGNYEPLNCRWATPLEQNRNKRNIIMNLSKALAIRTLYKCGTHSRKELADLFGVCRSSIDHIINDKQWVSV